MIRSIRANIRRFFTKGNERTILTKKNIAASFGIKGITILISLVLIPLTLNYIGAERNGIWLTLYSMMIWLNLFDIGFGNGMKNKLAEAKAKGETLLARKYISSTYAIVTLICLSIFIVFCVVNPHLDWIKILGSQSDILPYRSEITGLVWIFMASFCFTFVLNLLKFIVAADQRPAIGSFLDMLGQVLTLIGIFILSKTTTPSLIYLGWVSAFAPVIVHVIATIILFKHRYSDWMPSFRLINFPLAGKMMNLGIQFFVATCASFMITQTLPFLILRMTNPIEVTNYNTALRLFSVAFNVASIIVLPYWSSFTDAYTQNDCAWMKKSISHLRKIFVYMTVFQLLVLVLSPIAYYIWINYWMTAANVLNIPFVMSIVVCVYMCVLCWLNIFIYPLNGIGKVRLQVYSSLVEMALIIPCAFWLGQHFGAVGVLLAPIIIYIPRVIWAPIQLNKLIRHEATGIWNK
jgi:O-antigen/teichoic acid export membrane protein